MVNVATLASVRTTNPSGNSVEAAQVYTVSQLNQHTAQVLEQINISGRPAVVTRHGKFVVLITPLAGAQLESVVLSQGPLADEFADYAQQDAGSEQADLLSPDDVDRQIGWRSDKAH